jgi:hypothetical protein
MAGPVNRIPAPVTGARRRFRRLAIALAAGAGLVLALPVVLVGNGQGPSPDSPPSVSPATMAGFGLVGGATLLFVGWYSLGIRRSRRSSGGGR